MSALAIALFEAYSRNCGHNPDEHFDRNAAEQWMAQSIEEVGVAELIEAVSNARRLAREGASGAEHSAAAARVTAAIVRCGGQP